MPPKARSIPGPECKACLEGLAARAMDGAGLRGGVRVQVQQGINKDIAQGLADGKAPALIATRFLAEIRGASGVDDPFASHKAADMQAAGAAARALKGWERSWARACRAAIVGNALDFFEIGQPKRLIAQARALGLGVDHLKEAERLLYPGGRVVILADNCGEQAFDRILVAHLEARGMSVSYAVKSGPVQNDLTITDLKRFGEDWGLGEIVPTGTEQVGLDPRRVPPALEGLLERAAVVIAKGMGHYETLRRGSGLWPGGRVRWNILFLLMAKCSPVARSLGVAKGSGVALLERA